MTTARPLLSIQNLAVGFGPADQRVLAVRDVSIDVAPGESLGIVGESGCGKSMTALSILGLTGGHVSGQIVFEGRDLVELGQGELRSVRGGGIGMVFQDPMSSLNPIRPVGRQIEDVILAHRSGTRRDAAARAVELLTRVGIPDAARKAAALPHEFSGGMRQRVMIAMALSCDPRLLIADEPTTALDVTTQAQILELLRELRRELGMSLVLISHDFGVIGESVDRVAVMYAGAVVETGDIGRVLSAPEHPYTVGLLDSVRRLDGDRGRPLEPIPGSPPSPAVRITGCSFAPRCAFAMPECSQTPPVRHVPGGEVACWLPERPRLAPTVAAPAAAVSHDETRSPLLRVDDLTVWCSGRRRRRGARAAVREVSLELREGETLGLVGESGSGKSSTGRAIMRLVPVTGGRIDYRGDDVLEYSRREYRDFAREVKLIFQDPAASLDPRMTIRELVEEPLIVHGEKDVRVRDDRVARMLGLVGLGDGFIDRYPHEISGGQRQRVAVARALVSSPRIIICDEPVSALDVSVQAQVINLLRELRDELALTYLFISHDLRVVRYMSDRIAVMYQGRIVETGPTEEVYTDPKHPYTKLLLESVPSLEAGAPAAPQRADGDSVATEGCAFSARCPWARDVCRTIDPPLEVLADDSAVACHFWRTGAEETSDV